MHKPFETKALVACPLPFSLTLSPSVLLFQLWHECMYYVRKAYFRFRSVGQVTKARAHKFQAKNKAT